MSMILTRAKTASSATRALLPASVGRAQVASLPRAQARKISAGPKQDGDLGGPGGSEATPARMKQNRRFALITGGAVLATVAAYSLMTGRAEKIAPVPTRSVDEVVKKKQNRTPAEKGLRASRSD